MSAERTGRHVALVTGGNRHIGAGVALALAAKGYDVAVASRTGAEGTEPLLERLRACGVRATAQPCDVADPASVRDLHAALVADGFEVDVLVNNASHRPEQDFLDITHDDWQSVLEVTLGGAFRCAQAFVPHMTAHGWGRVVNIIGVRGQTGAPRRAHLVAAKSGLVGLTRALAHELGPSGITVNGVSPGTIATERDEADPARLAARGRGVVGRFGRADDVAGAVAYLADEQAGYVTGQILGVNGGDLMA